MDCEEQGSKWKTKSKSSLSSKARCELVSHPEICILDCLVVIIITFDSLDVPRTVSLTENTAPHQPLHLLHTQRKRRGDKPTSNSSIQLIEEELVPSSSMNQSKHILSGHVTPRSELRSAFTYHPSGPMSDHSLLQKVS